MRAVRNSLYVLLAGFLASGMLVACGGGDSGTNGGGGGGGGGGGRINEDTTIVTGQIHTVFDSAPTLRLSGTSARPGAASALQGVPDSATIGVPGEDGQTGRFATGPATSDSYTIPQVEPGENRLVVTIINNDDEAIGGVLVLDQTRADSILVTEPVNGETSLERALYQGIILGNQRIPVAHINPVQVALVTRFSEDVAAQAAMRRAEIQALVDAYEPAADVLVRGYIAMTGGLDSLSLNTAARGPAQAYAVARDGGATADEAHPDFVDGVMAAHAEVAGSPAQVSTIWGAWGTVHDDALAGATTLTRLQSAQNMLMISVSARRLLLAEVPDGTAGKDAVSTALDDIMAAGMGATDMAGFMSAVEAAVSDGADALAAARSEDLGSAMQAADLGAFVDTSMSPPEIAAALPGYISGVEDAAGDANLAALLIALMGGPGYSGG